jgi:2-isopropylmalate synthase
VADIQLYDATLRDGMGGGGLSLTAEEKLRVVHALDELGVHMVEAGFPASNPKEQELFGLLARERLGTAEIVAFGMTRRRDLAADRDAGLRILAESFAPACTLVGKASVLHVEKVVRVSREENLAMVADSVAFLVAAGKRVLFDAEHFFDGFALDPGYALDCLRAAADAGAERVVLCDTNGGSLPPQIRTASRSCAKRFRRPSSASTRTTTPAARSRTRSRRSKRGPRRCRAPSTGSASAPATPT